MVDPASEISFFRSNHARINIGIDMSISMRPMTTKFGRQVHLEELTHIRLVKQMLMTLYVNIT